MKRAPKAVWSDRDTNILAWLVSFYKRRHVDYTAIARVFANRTAKDIRKRCAVLRDHQRRQERHLELQHARNEFDMEPCDSPLAHQNASVGPHDGRLHPALVWKATEWHDLETLTL